MYIQQASKGQNEWWRYLITFLAALMAQVIGAIPLQIVVLKNAITTDKTKEFLQNFNPELIGISQNHGLILLLIPMVLTFFVLVLCIRYIHGYSFTHVFTSYNRFRWKNFFFGFFIWGILLVCADIINYQLNPENYEFNFNAASFYPLLLIAFLMIPLQAGAEELYIRGNLMQGFGILTRSRVFALLSTSIIFGLLHINNPEVKQFGIGISMAYYMGFGLFMGILVLLDDGLEMPLAIHAINNIYGSVFVGYSGSVLQTPAMFKVKEYDSTGMLVLFILASAIYLFIYKRIFNWNNFSKIFKPLEQEQ